MFVLSSLATQFRVKLFVNTPIVFALIQLVRLPRIKGIVALEARLMTCKSEQKAQLLAGSTYVHILLATSHAAGIAGLRPNIHTRIVSVRCVYCTHSHTRPYAHTQTDTNTSTNGQKRPRGRERTHANT